MASMKSASAGMDKAGESCPLSVGVIFFGSNTIVSSLVSALGAHRGLSIYHAPVISFKNSHERPYLGVNIQLGNT